MPGKLPAERHGGLLAVRHNAPMSVRSHLIVIPVLLGSLAACSGQSTDHQAAAETIEAGRPVQITMHDIGFDKSVLTVAAGTEVEFDFTNTGKIPHDAFIGDHAAQLEHDAEMAAMTSMTSMAGMGDMPGHGQGGHAITVQPGERGTITYTFANPGTYEIGCHQPGHYAAGMTITIIVT